MNLYSIKPNIQWIDRMEEWLKDNFVSIGYPGIGDLDCVGKDDLRDRLAMVYDYRGHVLEERVEEINVFVNEIQDGDYILVEDKKSDSIYLGDVGDYYYVESSDSVEDGLCHRRGVTWLNRIPRSELNAYIQELLSHPGAVKPFAFPLAWAQLDAWMAPTPNPNLQGKTASATDQQVPVDRRTIEEALDILRLALRSEDADRRERAAAAILHYAKQ